MKSAHQKRVEEFMLRAKQEVPKKPTLPDSSILRLRAALILEEALETIEALGCEVLVERQIPVTKRNAGVITVRKPDLVEIADGCADISVVTIGTLSACGIDDGSLLKLVDENNLEKFGEGHSLRPDGKLIKPEGHKPPDIAKLLKVKK